MKAIPSKMHSLSSLGVDSSEKEVIQEYKNSKHSEYPRKKGYRPNKQYM